MIAPDHTPFLRPGDLVTAEDAAEWLRQQAEDEPRATAWYLYERLTARLDRERRQACRRGALDHWRRHCIAVRLLAKAANARERFEYETCGTRLRAAALAYRAAARGGR